MDQEPDYYEVLGLKRDATPEAIKAAYRERARQYHGDRVQHLSEKEREEAHYLFTKVAEAYKVLANPVDRERYDRRYRPIRTLMDLLQRVTGLRIRDLLFARTAKEPQRGEDLVSTVSIPAEQWRPGARLVLKVDDDTLSVPVPEQLDQHWLRVSGAGVPGVNGGPAGDRLIYVHLRS